MSVAGSRPKKRSPKQQRKIALDAAESAPLWRADIQFDLLSAIFANQVKVFTGNSNKLTFGELYTESILRSPKAKTVLKDKLSGDEASEFATDFAKLALLVNVGRVGASMSFFLETRTTQRSYHPIPSLQHSKGNLLDAPRIKSVLRACEDIGESKGQLTTPTQMLARAKAGQIPPTTLPNLLFVLSNHSAQIGHDHLHDVEFLDLFLPSATSSQSRAQLFLYFCYHYHEAPTGDLDDDSHANPFAGPDGKPPTLITLTSEESAQENVDSAEEKEHAEALVTQREGILREYSKRESAKEKTEQPSKAKAKRGGAKRPVNNDKDDDDANGDYALSERPSSVRGSSPHNQGHRRYSPYPMSRNYLQYTWQLLLSAADPLDDSDEDDEYSLVQRLAVLAELRQQSPTPEPAGLQPIPRPLA
ncbi:Ino eighty subunit 1 [Mycena indigotica]|uniref:Ino eighty subunit 1 n=1 Tax=Mycena indigotica TaxID=2126181 RepID=A0A8H6W5M4_9AGAR|nr:Ino eighty subunit 1 [Mycena indigotica]KAF7306689.1 Ino eighty subunit 1 [Mycena indigotica]